MFNVNEHLWNYPHIEMFDNQPHQQTFQLCASGQRPKPFAVDDIILSWERIAAFELPL